MKILICDGHEIFRIGIDQLIHQLPCITSIDEVSNGNEAIAMLKKGAYDIVLVDISLPRIGGLELLELIKTKWRSVKVLVFSSHAQVQYAKRALKLGASGYLTKDSASEELLVALKKIAGGGKYISHSLAENIALYPDNGANVPIHDTLSKREYVTMLKLANGKSLSEIGKELLVSIKTVSTYRSRIMKKMELGNNAALTKYCLRNKLIRA